MNGVLYDVVYRLYQGVLYVQNAIKFHGTRVNVISLTPIFTNPRNAQYLYVHILYTELYSKQTLTLLSDVKCRRSMQCICSFGTVHGCQQHINVKYSEYIILPTVKGSVSVFQETCGEHARMAQKD
jgi:hypothetical protein